MESTSIVEMNNVCLQYDKKIIFDCINYEFNNSVYLLQGESGVGKTTLLNMICGYISPDKGSIQYSNVNKINYLFQDYMLFHNLTVRDNLYMKYVALEKKENEFEKYAVEAARKFGMDSMLNKVVGTLSGGERQRVQLAIMSLEEYDVILMDEPIANLDRRNSKVIMDYVKEIQNKLIIIVSHQYINPSENYTLLELREGKLYEV